MNLSALHILQYTYKGIWKFSCTFTRLKEDGMWKCRKVSRNFHVPSVSAQGRYCENIQYRRRIILRYTTSCHDLGKTAPFGRFVDLEIKETTYVNKL